MHSRQVQATQRRLSFVLYLLLLKKLQQSRVMSLHLLLLLLLLTFCSKISVRSLLNDDTDTMAMDLH
jgi:hypothetical protein